MQTYPFSILEAVSYNLLRGIPLIFLAFYPFQDKRRFSDTVMAVIYAVIMALWMFLSLFNIYFSVYSKVYSALLEGTIFILISAIYVFGLKGHPGKMLFNCFLLINAGYLMTVTSKCLEYYVFPDTVMNRYSWSASVCLCIVSVLILYPLYRFMKWEREVLVQDVQNTYVWQYSWLVPVTFYLVWAHDFYGSGNPLEWSIRPSNVFFVILVNAASIMIYYLIIMMIKDNNSYRILQEENHVMSMQLLQYEGLNQRIAAAREGRHDLRHHILGLESLAEKEDLDGIRSYLQEMGKKYQVEGPLLYCSNMTVNGVLSYFAMEAQKADIQYEVSVGIPEDVMISKTDLSILFGNLLENAVEACQRQTAGERKIIVRGKTTQGNFTLTIDNTYQNEPSKDMLGRFRSLKHPGAGIGTESVKTIVSKYHGVISFETRGDLFCVSVMLYLQSG